MSSSMLNHRFFRAYKNNEYNLIRVRVKNDFSAEVIHMGMFEKTLKDDEEFTLAEIKEAISMGWLKKDKVNTPKGLRTVYLWLGQEMASGVWYKRWIKNVCKWWVEFWSI